MPPKVDPKKLPNTRRDSNKGNASESVKQPEITEKVYICGDCREEVDDHSIECSECRQWFHRICGNLDEEEFAVLHRGNQGIIWKCLECLTVKGNEVKRLMRLEERLDAMMSLVTSKFDNLEQTLLAIMVERIDKKIEEKLEQKVEIIEERISTKFEKKMEEDEERDRRKNNLVLWNIPESDKTESEERKLEDLKKVEETVHKVMSVEEGEFINPIRIGKVGGSKPRLLKVTVRNQEKRGNILRHASRLNHNVKNPEERIYINPDLTPQEREREKKARD